MSDEQVSNDDYPRPAELEDRLDDISESGTADSGGGQGASVSTNPNSEAEREEMAVADAPNKQDPGQQAGGGQFGG